MEERVGLQKIHKWNQNTKFLDFQFHRFPKISPSNEWIVFVIGCAVPLICSLLIFKEMEFICNPKF